jgi:hypothetical protein
VSPGAVHHAGRAPASVEEPLASLDRYTRQALTTGRVALPGRTIHAGVWFRLLRSLLDEVSLALTTRSRHGRTTLELVWQATGRPERAGLNQWRPYENLEPDTQARLGVAAPAAPRLRRRPALPAPGRVAGSDGRAADRDHPGARGSGHRPAAADPAHHRLPHPRPVQEQRAFLFGIGIPAAFLPSARELGRHDLT